MGGKLNIKYGINGTGKTTIGKAILYKDEKEKLEELDSYIYDEKAEVQVDAIYKKIAVFNDNFLERIVFQPKDIMNNSFDIFLKSENYDENRKILNDRLKNIKDIVEDEEFDYLLTKFSEILNKFKKTKNGKISATGTYKSLKSKNNIYNIPKELDIFSDWFESADNIKWIGWKNKGSHFDLYDNCPYCGQKKDAERSELVNAIFEKTCSKNTSEYLQDFLELLESLEDYFSVKKYKEIVKIVREDVPECMVEDIIEAFVNEVERLYYKLDCIKRFGHRDILITDIGGLPEQLAKMKINIESLSFLRSRKVSAMVKKLEKQVELVINDASKLQREIATLRGTINRAIKNVKSDINEFLEKSGIPYMMEIDTSNPFDNRAYIKYVGKGNKSEVDNIRKHLSYGERNALAMILFMYYANEQKADLIILDDPISSFDSNKKYSILHRMFKVNTKQKVSFKGKTVLLLTHDFEPIIDFVKVGKLQEVYTTFISNEYGILKEMEIADNQDIVLVVDEYRRIASNTKINRASRVAFLRKLSEMKQDDVRWTLVYNLLSCLIHNKKPEIKYDSKKTRKMTSEEKVIAENIIRRYMADFDYDEYNAKYFEISTLIEEYRTEKNKYYKLQIFREICERDNELFKNIKSKSSNEGWYKYIDESYHLGDEYLFYLNLDIYNIVPSYISEAVEKVMDEYVLQIEKNKKEKNYGNTKM